MKYGEGMSLLLLFLWGTWSCKPEKVEPLSFPAERVYTIHIDHGGTVWAGSDVGLLSFNGNEWKIHQAEGLPEGEIRDLTDILGNSGPELWMASTTGASIARYTEQKIQSVTSYHQEAGKLLDNEIRSLVIDSLKACWYATPLGLSIFADSIWLNEDDFGDLILHPVNALGSTSSGWVLAGTSGLGVGRYKLDEGIDGVSGASYYTKAWTGLPSDTILSVYVMEDNTQWFGTTGGIAYHNAWSTKTGWTPYDTRDGIIDNRVQCIETGPNGDLWVGTPRGTSVFDGSQWTSYTEEDGLGNEEINDLAIDRQGNVWFATANGITVYDGKVWIVYAHNSKQ